MAAAAVAAVEGMTRALALDLAPIRVNAVAPGLIDTPLWDSFGAQREAILAQGAGLPVGRIGRPEEVAAAVIFLMSNGFVTGTVLPIAAAASSDDNSPRHGFVRNKERKGRNSFGRANWSCSVAAVEVSTEPGVAPDRGCITVSATSSSAR